MSCCNHFRDFLVLSSADLTRLTLVDAASCPAPGCQQITKHKIYCPPGRRRLTVKHCPEPEVGRGLFFFSLDCCCFCFKLLLFSFRSSFSCWLFSLLLFRTNAHTHTHRAKKRNDEVISLFAWICCFLRFLPDFFFSLPLPR